MKIENQVCTLEQAKRLNELGINQDSYFAIGETGIVTEGWSIDGTEDVFFAAFTVAELGAMLAHGTGMCSYHHGKWKAEYQHPNVRPEEKNKGTGTTHYLVHQATEAQARAAFLIYSLENGFLKVEEVNQRLSA